MAPDEPASSSTGSSVVHKAIAGVFVTVLAPVLVAFGIKFSDTLLTVKPEGDKHAAPAATAADSSPAATAQAVSPQAISPPSAASPSAASNAITPAPAVQPAATPSNGPSPTAVATIVAASPPPAPRARVTRTGLSTTSDAKSPATGAAAIDKDELHFPHFKRPTSPVVRLFNGRDLTGFYTYLGAPQPRGTPYGKNYDPEKVFSVAGGQLVVSGQMVGALETVKEYSDYWLTLEYKWGERTWPPRADEARHCDVLVNVDGPDGVVRGVLPDAIHCQISEGSAGDFLLATGRGEHGLSLTVATEEREVKHGPNPHLAYFYKPGQPLTTLTDGVIRRYPPVIGVRDVKGFRPPNDVERPHGDWNTLDIVVLDGKIFVQLNDHVVNFARQSTPTAGRIGIQSNGAEIFFRTITLQEFRKAKVIGQHQP